MVSTMHYVVPSACILDFYRLVMPWRKSHAIRISKSVSIKHGLRTADYGLRTGYKTRTRYKTRTTDWV